MILKVRLWGKDVAAISWDDDRGFATIEFYQSFAGNCLNISPLMMPLYDVMRGERTFFFQRTGGKPSRDYPGYWQILCPMITETA